jgi:hypothetical protein
MHKLSRTVLRGEGRILLLLTYPVQALQKIINRLEYKSRKIKTMKTYPPQQ